MLGPEITVLVRGVGRSRCRKVGFDARGLASGVYFCRLQAGGFHHTGKPVNLNVAMGIAPQPRTGCP